MPTDNLPGAESLLVSIGAQRLRSLGLSVRTRIDAFLTARARDATIDNEPVMRPESWHTAPHVARAGDGGKGDHPTERCPFPGEPQHTAGSAQAVIMKIITEVAQPVNELRKNAFALR